MVQQQTLQGYRDKYAKEMEQFSAKKFLLLAIESKFLLTTRLSVEGHTRMKEEYVEGLLETPTVSEAAVPEQLKVSAGQAAGTL